MFNIVLGRAALVACAALSIASSAVAFSDESVSEIRPIPNHPPMGDVMLRSVILGKWSDATRCGFTNCWRDVYPNDTYSSFTVVLERGWHVRLGNTFYMQCSTGAQFTFPVPAIDRNADFAEIYPNYCPGGMVNKITMQAGLDAEHNDAQGILNFYGNY